MSATNTTFTHAQFWVHVWGVPSEMMAKEVGEAIGHKLGRFISMDKRTWTGENAIFLRIKVEIPMDCPLRRRGHVLSPEGERIWVMMGTNYKRVQTLGKAISESKWCRIQGLELPAKSPDHHRQMSHLQPLRAILRILPPAKYSGLPQPDLPHTNISEFDPFLIPESSVQKTVGSHMETISPSIPDVVNYESADTEDTET
ncbi:gdsl esterase/lipase, partial [Fagus crenata]